MKLNPERWNRIDAILDELLELPENQRLNKLRSHCGSDSTLMADIAKLLADCETNSGLLDQNALQLVRTLMDQLAPDASPAPNPHSLKGLRLGAYTLEEEIGRGGMGVVYKASRTQGDYAQNVAIKILMNVNVTVAERFRREQQALAVLKHPNITQLLDAGVTDQGLPYLIMELIEGESITDYCAKRALSLTERLLILDQVLEALAFSHKNLIVHRDIKPSNILVTSSGQVKLLDFSIAKLLDAAWELEETATHLHLMTPSYSAPEQVLNQPITVATDIYQLGLLYFRILTGHNPLARDVSSLHALVKIVCQTEVARPSHAVSQSEGREESFTNTQDVRRNLTGDLDAILLKMLRKEPGARYPSIEALRADLYAYRHHLPVAAHRAALGYQTGKYLRRNWRTIAVTSAACFALLGYAGSMQVQNSRVKTALAKAELEQRKAEQVSQFLAQTFEAADPNKGGLKGITAADLLEDARTKINEELKDSPEIQAPLLNIFSKIYFRQQEYQKAETLLSNLVNNPKTAQQLDRKLLAEIQLRLAQQKIGLGQYTEAEVLLRKSLALQMASPTAKSPDNPVYGETLAFLGHNLYFLKRESEATAMIQEAIAYLEKLGESGDRMRSFALNVLANNQYLYTNLDAAIENMREALAIKRKILGEAHTETSSTQLLLARMLVDRDDFAEAQVLAEAAYKDIGEQLPPGHPYHATALGTLAKLAQKQQQHDRALELVDKITPKSSTGTNSTSRIHANLYTLDILIDQGNSKKSQQLIDQINELNLNYPNSKSIKARLYSLQGRLYLMGGEYQQALEQINQALELLDPKQMEAVVVIRDKSIALIALGYYHEAAELLNQAINTLHKRYAEGHSQVRLSCFVLKQIFILSDSTAAAPTGNPCANVTTTTKDFHIPGYLSRWKNIDIN